MNIKDWLKGDKKTKILFAAGIAAILLIFLTSFWPERQTDAGEAAAAEQTQAQETIDNAAYEQRYQERILALVKQVAGVGEAQVAVTLRSGVEYVYAKEESKTVDTQNSDNTNVSERNSLEQKTILVEDENGHRQALLRTTLEPTVRGVVVVCEGGSDPTVIAQVTDVVKTALGIGANQVCVAPLQRNSIF